MENKKVYIYADNEYAGSLILDDSDKSPSGAWNIPACCTEIEPPVEKEGFLRVWNGINWEYKEIKKEPVESELTLEELKENKLLEAKRVFVQKRDAIRWVQVDETHTYGFDCASEDITNFLAAYTFLDTQVEKSNTTMYKVWLDKENKGIVELNLEQMSKVFDIVRNSQFETYAWLEQIQTKIEACQSKEDLEAIVLE
ncbi:MAG TPA: hypothetical protein K8V99_08940 [Megamonas funiformis]|nr:hypothetical protein [Megamonas funiformis]